MSKRFNSQHEIDTFLKEPRLAMLIYSGSRPAPTGVPVWFDWDGKMVRIFTSRSSPKVRQLTKNPNISVLVTNRVGEPEGCVAFNGKVTIKDNLTQFQRRHLLQFLSDTSLLPRLSPRGALDALNFCYPILLHLLGSKNDDKHDLLDRQSH